MELKIKPNSVLTREDFDGGPVSLDLIEDKLYLGNVTAACDLPTLSRLNITHILTIDSVPLPRHITDNKNLINKYIQVSDMPKEDLLSLLDSTNEFISNAMENNNTVLVHCYYGMSRSATVVIAYFMNKYKMNYEEAYQSVKNKRNLVNPNPGFVTQLKLYGSMNSKLDLSNNKYKNYRLKIAADKVRKVKILPQSCMYLIQPDPGLMQAKPDPLVYRCRKCRRIVASQSHIINHHRKTKSNEETSCSNVQTVGISSSSLSTSDEQTKSNSSCFGSESHIEDISTFSDLDIAGKDSSKQKSNNYCTQTYFVEPIAWMKDITHNTEGKLYCPHCRNKLGSFNWLMGCQCPCGTKLSPAFYLVPSKVEWSNIVQNVESTL